MKKVIYSIILSGLFFIGHADQANSQDEYLPKSLLYKKIIAEKYTEVEQHSAQGEMDINFPKDYIASVTDIFSKFVDKKDAIENGNEEEKRIALFEFAEFRDSEADTKIIKHSLLEEEFAKINAIKVDIAEPNLTDEEGKKIIFSQQQNSKEGLFADIRPYNIRKSSKTGAVMEVGERKEDLAGLGMSASSLLDKTDKMDLSFEYYADLGSENPDLNVERRSFGAGPVAKFKIDEKSDFKFGYQAQMKYGESDHTVKWELRKEF
jgi:hypothetical protein